jgi:hypothetical protein
VDSRGYCKCVLRRKWELQKDVGLDTSIQMHLAVGDENLILCFQCGGESGKEEFMVKCVEGKAERVSMLCKAC